MNVRATAGGVLAGSAALIIAVSMLAVMGDTFPTHVGMTRDADGTLAVKVALCPGEQVRAVEVTTEAAPHHTWRVTGPGSTVDTWVVGAEPPDGFVEVESAPEDAFLRDDVSVRVETNQDRWDALVGPLQVTGGAVLFENEPTVSSRFAEIARHRYPCDDPTGRLGTWKWVSRALLVAAALFAAAAALLVEEQRGRTNRHDLRAGWYADPDDPTAVRWWNGSRWTAAVAVPRAGTARSGHRLLPMTGTVLIVAGFLTTLIAPAVGAEHHLRPEAAWVALLHEASLDADGARRLLCHRRLPRRTMDEEVTPAPSRQCRTIGSGWARRPRR